VARRVERGLKLLEGQSAQISSFDCTRKNAAIFMGYLAQWVDIGFVPPVSVKEIVSSFSQAVREQISIREYVYLRMAQGMVAMFDEAVQQAIHHFDFVRSLAGEISEREVLAVANFWKGRCLRMRGEYEQALAYTVEGKNIALELGHTPMAAVMQVLESWLHFQKEDLKAAELALREAHKILQESDDYLTLGNIHSAYGRIARRQGRYQHAIEHFEAAIGEYKKRDPQHRNVARSLANLAYVKRLIMRQVARKIDSDAALQRRNSDSQGSMSRAQYFLRLTELQQEAFAALDEAAQIYAIHPHHHGTGNVHLNRAYLLLDNGDVEQAEEEAGAAFEIGQQKQDNILMARAQLLRCMIENAQLEEGVEDVSDPSHHARMAQDCAQQAVELAKLTQDRRLLAQAYVWVGMTSCNGFFENLEFAQQSYDEASKFMTGAYTDSAWEDMQALKVKILRHSGVDRKLKAWSQGSLGGKTFQQLADEFAQLIVPKVWEREDRKVSRVAERLSISPKKVRKILTKAGKRKPG
jgi:tetratricopeptide (TPR) repeat protein